MPRTPSSSLEVGECNNEPQCSGHFHYRSILTSLEKLQQLVNFKAEPTDLCSMAREGWLLFLYVLSWEKPAFHKQVQLEKSLYIHSLLPLRIPLPGSFPRAAPAKHRWMTLDLAFPRFWGNELLNSSCSHHYHNLIGHRWHKALWHPEFRAHSCCCLFKKINLKGCQPQSCSESPFYLLTICSETSGANQCESSLSCNSFGCIQFEILQHKMYLAATDPSRRGSTSLPHPAWPGPLQREHVLEVCTLSLSPPTAQPHPSKPFFLKISQAW